MKLKYLLPIGFGLISFVNSFSNSSIDEYQNLWSLSFVKGVKVQNAKWVGFNPCVIPKEKQPEKDNYKEENHSKEVEEFDDFEEVEEVDDFEDVKEVKDVDDLPMHEETEDLTDFDGSEWEKDDETYQDEEYNLDEVNEPEN